MSDDKRPLRSLPRPNATPSAVKARLAQKELSEGHEHPGLCNDCANVEAANRELCEFVEAFHEKRGCSLVALASSGENAAFGHGHVHGEDVNAELLTAIGDVWNLACKIAITGEDDSAEVAESARALLVALPERLRRAMVEAIERGGLGAELNAN